MILNENSYKTKSNVGQTSTFQIQSSSKAFKILSSNLYKDKITAVIRELSTNAVDAHIAKGFNGKINIHVPTFEDPNFIVTDKGIGMTEIEIYQLYTTYFGSNKSDSNDYTGALGLGSKSPFAYTDQFTVESSKDGVKNVFTCFLDDMGMPTLSKVASMKSATTGTKVIVPVNENDIRSFEEKIVGVYEYFDKVPNIDKQKVLDRLLELRKNRKVIVKGKGYEVLEIEGSYYNDNAFEIVMGNIKYPLSLKEIRSLHVPLVDAIHNVFDRSLVLYAEIGQLDIAPSREELSYDRTTINNIRAMLMEADALFQKNVEKKIKNFKTKKEEVLYISKNMRFLKGFKNPNLEIHVDGDRYKNDRFMETYRLTERYNNSRGKYTMMKKTSIHQMQIDSLFRATFIEYPLDEINKRGRKNTIIEYCRAHRELSDNVILIDPAGINSNMFIEGGCEYITKADLPDVEKVESTYKRQTRIELDEHFNCKKIENILEPEEITYYLISYRNMLHTLNDSLGIGNTKYTNMNTRSFLTSLGIPVVIIKTNIFLKNKGKILKSKKLVELTKEKIDSIIIEKLLKKIDKFSEALVMKSLNERSDYSNLRFFGGLSERGLTVIRETPNYLTDEENKELMLVPMFKKIYKFAMKQKEFNDLNDEYSTAISHVERLMIPALVKKMVVSMDITKINAEYKEYSELRDELLNNILIKSFLGSFGYYTKAREFAKDIYSAFVKL